MEKFLAQFEFKPEGAMLVGIERETLLTQNGNIVPIAEKVLKRLNNHQRYGYELSACQLEDRVGPTTLPNLMNELLGNEAEIKKAEQELGFQRWHYEVGPDDMPLDVYPDPTERYQRITENMPKDILLAACRVIATHVHIGMPDHQTALRAYNKVIDHCDELCRIGDGSCGERLEIYKKMAPDFNPPFYAGWNSFYEEAIQKGFLSDPRKCWHLIRLSIHGTIEFRMFGATSELSRIVSWAKRCHELCQSYMC